MLPLKITSAFLVLGQLDNVFELLGMPFTPCLIALLEVCNNSIAAVTTDLAAPAVQKD